MTASEPFEVNNEYWRDVVDLYFLDCLFVVNTSIAVPGIGLWQLLRPVELPKTVINAYTFRQFFPRVHLTLPLVVWVFIMNEAVKARVQRPTLLVIKLDEQLKLKIIAFWSGWDAFRVVLRATPCALAWLFRLLFVLLRRLCLLLIGDLGRLPVLFVEEMRLRRNSGLCQHLAQRDLVVEL